MTSSTPPLTIAQLNLEELEALNGVVALLINERGTLSAMGRAINKLTGNALKRVIASEAFEKADASQVFTLAYPAKMAAEKVVIVKADLKKDGLNARDAGAAIAAQCSNGQTLHLMIGDQEVGAEVVLGAMLRSYAYTAQKSQADDPALVEVIAHVEEPDEFAEAEAKINARVQGVHFTRDLTNAPANVLTTSQFADELTALSELGLTVRVMEEVEMTELGMGALLGVGQGSESPSKIVVMEWNGGGEESPVAFVGKGVVFDTGGISLKPAAGMEDMTMDMGGAGVVSGVMKTLAMRQAKANVVGLVGLVENMPDGRAQRPGDVVTSMKGDTIEVINTDAEGRLVLCDVMWYAQETFKPKAMIDLATLTGAIIIGLGHENAGVFSNSDALSDALLKAAGNEGEGAWRMPLAPAYDKLLKSRVADMKNIGGRAAGSITAAQFLQRFVKEDTPWCHIDIAGVASIEKGTKLSPAGATGWGVLTLDRLIKDVYES